MFKKLGKAWLASISCGVVNFMDNIPIRESKHDNRLLFLEVIKVLPKVFLGAIDRGIITFFDIFLTRESPRYTGPMNIYPSATKEESEK